MALYLQLDGVDDRLSVPSFAFDEVQLDIWYEQTTGSFLMLIEAPAGTARTITRNGSNQNAYSGFTSAYVDNVAVTNNTLFIPTNRRAVLKATSASITSGSFIGANQVNQGFTKVKIYTIRFLNAGTTVAYYDMNTGTAQDQSGNGRHATLSGGTWVSDAPSGTAGSASYATKQVINRVSSAAYATKQTFYQTASVSYATQQAITSVGIPGTVSYATKQVINQTGNVQLATKQRLYQVGSVSWLTQQTIYDPSQAVASRIKLRGVLQTRVTLQGVMQTRVKLRGEIEMKIVLRGDSKVTAIKQDVKMISGDTRILEIPVTNKDNPGATLSGTIYWYLKQSGRVILTKSTGSGITISGNTCEVTVDPADTAKISGDFEHEVKVTNVLGQVGTVMRGSFEIID